MRSMVRGRVKARRSSFAPSTAFGGPLPASRVRDQSRSLAGEANGGMVHRLQNPHRAWGKHFFDFLTTWLDWFFDGSQPASQLRSRPDHDASLAAALVVVALFTGIAWLCTARSRSLSASRLVSPTS